MLFACVIFCTEKLHTSLHKVVIVLFRFCCFQSTLTFVWGMQNIIHPIPVFRWKGQAVVARWIWTGLRVKTGTRTESLVQLPCHCGSPHSESLMRMASIWDGAPPEFHGLGTARLTLVQVESRSTSLPERTRKTTPRHHFSPIELSQIKKHNQGYY